MNGTLTMILPLIVLLAVMYFLLIRPQKKREKEYRELQQGLRNISTLATAACQYRDRLFSR